MLIYIVRHGETIQNTQGIVQGHANGQLNTVGIHQAHLLAERFRTIPLTHIYSSDLERALHTAQAVQVHHSEIPFISTTSLRERSYGPFDGRKKMEVLVELGKLPTDSFHETVDSLMGVETPEQLRMRAKDFLEEILRTHESSDTILIVTHSDFINRLIAYLQKNNGLTVYDLIKFGNTSVSLFEYTNDHRKPHFTNDTSHLPSAG